MPEYNSEEERPDREELYDRGIGDVLPARFDVEEEDRHTHPQVELQSSGAESYHVRIYDMRTKREGGEKVCCRAGYGTIGIVSEYADVDDDEDFETIAEAETWLMKITKALLVSERETSNVSENLTTQVTLHD